MSLPPELVYMVYSFCDFRTRLLLNKLLPWTATQKQLRHKLPTSTGDHLLGVIKKPTPMEHDLQFTTGIITASGVCIAFEDSGKFVYAWKRQYSSCNVHGVKTWRKVVTGGNGGNGGKVRWTAVPRNPNYHNWRDWKLPPQKVKWELSADMVSPVDRNNWDFVVTLERFTPCSYLDAFDALIGGDDPEWEQAKLRILECNFRSKR